MPCYPAPSSPRCVGPGLSESPRSPALGRGRKVTAESVLEKENEFCCPILPHENHEQLTIRAW